MEGGKRPGETKKRPEQINYANLKNALSVSSDKALRDHSHASRVINRSIFLPTSLVRTMVVISSGLYTHGCCVRRFT